MAPITNATLQTIARDGTITQTYIFLEVFGIDRWNNIKVEITSEDGTVAIGKGKANLDGNFVLTTFDGTSSIVDVIQLSETLVGQMRTIAKNIVNYKIASEAARQEAARQEAARQAPTILLAKYTTYLIPAYGYEIGVNTATSLRNAIYLYPTAASYRAFIIGAAGQRLAELAEPEVEIIFTASSIIAANALAQTTKASMLRKLQLSVKKK